ncbi:response regulator transcription factor [Actinomadura barringtoniae]|uniref:Response regulator transcription factor n=1 Tax=Actinomadura barringtoniae TaxID=1427535 RepID=A0A939T652_9ACTN|nr:response regulator transcription factor [Actinomadura barringtoniae]MBO2451478.1 response regulator transcription factor [Actinomadura barringtoniae]
MRVLLVEDDRRFAAALIRSLGPCGYEIEHVVNGADALAAPESDLVLLDLGLADGDGLEVCRRLRRDSEVAIIILSARGTERDRVAGLRGGADDYLVKPFSVAELQARMEAVLRRVRPRTGGVLTVGGLDVNLDCRTASVNGVAVRLTPKEFTLLAALAREQGSVIMRERLQREVWGTAWHGTSRTLDVHVSTLRTKIRDGARVEVVHAVGYRLVPSEAGAPPQPEAPQPGAARAGSVRAEVAQAGAVRAEAVRAEAVRAEAAVEAAVEAARTEVVRAGAAQAEVAQAGAVRAEAARADAAVEVARVEATRLKAAPGVAAVQAL